MVVVLFATMALIGFRLDFLTSYVVVSLHMMCDVYIDRVDTEDRKLRENVVLRLWFCNSVSEVEAGFQSREKIWMANFGKIMILLTCNPKETSNFNFGRNFRSVV